MNEKEQALAYWKDLTNTTSHGHADASNEVAVSEYYPNYTNECIRTYWCRGCGSDMEVQIIIDGYVAN